MSYAPQGPGPYQPSPYPAGAQPAGMNPGMNAGQNPAQLQAAWRFSARRKNETAAWLLWIGGPFLVGLPIHDFYFGDIGKGLAKIGLLVVSFVSFFVGMIITGIAAESNASAAPVGLVIGLGLAGLCVLASIAWWIYDGVVMSRRIESKNNQIRQEIASEQGIDPWSF